MAEPVIDSDMPLPPIAGGESFLARTVLGLPISGWIIFGLGFIKAAQKANENQKVEFPVMPPPAAEKTTDKMNANIRKIQNPLPIEVRNTVRNAREALLRIVGATPLPTRLIPKPIPTKP